jgi:hypothetical protein
MTLFATALGLVNYIGKCVKKNAVHVAEIVYCKNPWGDIF